MCITVSGTCLNRWIPIILYSHLFVEPEMVKWTKEGHKFFDIPPIYKWNFCPLPLNLGELYVCLNNWMQWKGYWASFWSQAIEWLAASTSRLLKYLLLDLAAMVWENPSIHGKTYVERNGDHLPPPRSSVQRPQLSYPSQYWFASHMSKLLGRGFSSPIPATLTDAKWNRD